MHCGSERSPASLLQIGEMQQRSPASLLHLSCISPAEMRNQIRRKYL
jgi:hypothetical protein